jgi:hypothetical protein
MPISATSLLVAAYLFVAFIVFVMRVIDAYSVIAPQRRLIPYPFTFFLLVLVVGSLALTIAIFWPVSLAMTLLRCAVVGQDPTKESGHGINVADGEAK